MDQTHQSDYQIEVNGLWKVFGDNPERALEPEYSEMSRAEIQDELDLVVGLRDISFRVSPGQIFVIMGLSGSGKSTLVRCLIRLIESTKGEINFDGEDIVQYSQDELIEFRRNKVAMVFQHYGLLPHRNVIDNVSYGLEIQGMDKEERYGAASEAIRTVGLEGWEEYFPREMSGGMQQRVGLARALAVNSPSLMMDEPFSGLDPLIRREMQDELITLQTEPPQDHRVHNARPGRGAEAGRPDSDTAGRGGSAGRRSARDSDPAGGRLRVRIRAGRVQVEGDTGAFHHADSHAGRGRIPVLGGPERLYRRDDTARRAI